jgi:hypothetical protein
VLPIYGNCVLYCTVCSSMHTVAVVSILDLINGHSPREGISHFICALCEVSVSTVCAMKMVLRLNEVMTQRLINLTCVVLGSLGTLRTV